MLLLELSSRQTTLILHWTVIWCFFLLQLLGGMWLIGREVYILLLLITAVVLVVVVVVVIIAVISLFSEDECLSVLFSYFSYQIR